MISNLCQISEIQFWEEPNLNTSVYTWS